MKINAVEAASLRHLITIDEAVDMQDSNGDPVRTWQEFAQVHAAVELLRANEIIALQTIHGVVDTRFVMRRDATTAQITAKHRIRYRDVIYDLRPPQDVELRGTRLEILARSGVNDG